MFMRATHRTTLNRKCFSAHEQPPSHSGSGLFMGGGHSAGVDEKKRDTGARSGMADGGGDCWCKLDGALRGTLRFCSVIDRR